MYMQSQHFDQNRITIILPVHNEEIGLEGVVKAIDAAFREGLSTLPFLIFVDDGSSDNSLSVIRRIILERSNALCLKFSRNFGHQVAVMAGFVHAPKGSIVVVMDSDGQDPPVIAIELVKQILIGIDIAYGIRWRRVGRNYLKRIAYWSFYRILAFLSSVKIPLDAGDFCAYAPKAAEIVSNIQERYPYVRGIRAWIGLVQVGVPYKRPERIAGQSSYDFRGLFRLAFDGIIGFSLKPLRIAIAIGFCTFLLSITLIFIYLVAYLFDWHFLGQRMRDAPGFTTLVLLILTSGSMQMLMLGVIGEYLGRLFEQSKGRPLFIISEIIGTEANSSAVSSSQEQWK